MKRFLLAIGGLVLAAAMSPAQAVDLPFILTTTPVLVLPDTPSGLRLRLHLENIGGPAAWSAFCSFSLKAQPQAAVPATHSYGGGLGQLPLPAMPALAPNAPGSFEVAPGRPVDFSRDAIPAGDLWCVGYQGGDGNGPPIPFTVDVIQSGY